MKKTLSLILTIIILLFSTISVFAEGEDSIISQTTEYFEDGSYIITILTIEDENTTTRATSTKSGSKTITIYNSYDEKLVVLKLTATFNYTGSSATCTSAVSTYTLYNSNYKVTSSSGITSGNKGIGNFTVKKYFVGVPIKTMEHTITITCSNTGVLS